ncbi:hypothetical protein NQ318_016204 [Aromia moschata]|uniref:SWIM-type domain-containing protein n=1 Tax=Aromia moschata TaxID=1265417 RepID=A0AAV8YF83_9CUCU|nr:hypothetical protein NQ318_016204 [Aromia moschata]
MKLFRDILFSTHEEAEENATRFFSTEEVINNKCVNEYTVDAAYKTHGYKPKFEWYLAYRIEIITRGNNTNNYTEASIRIFKDIVLQRCKAFNACALVEFVSPILENYYKTQNIFHVASESENFLYTVYTDIACCDCPYGASGRYCKHLCAIENSCGIFFKNSPLLQETDKTLLAKIAVGEDAPSNFYSNMCTPELGNSNNPFESA